MLFLKECVQSCQRSHMITRTELIADDTLCSIGSRSLIASSTQATRPCELPRHSWFDKLRIPSKRNCIDSCESKMPRLTMIKSEIATMRMTPTAAPLASRWDEQQVSWQAMLASRCTVHSARSCVRIVPRTISTCSPRSTRSEPWRHLSVRSRQRRMPAAQRHRVLTITSIPPPHRPRRPAPPPRTRSISRARPSEQAVSLSIFDDSNSNKNNIFRDRSTLCS